MSNKFLSYTEIIERENERKEEEIKKSDRLYEKENDVERIYFLQQLLWKRLEKIEKKITDQVLNDLKNQIVDNKESQVRSVLYFDCIRKGNLVENVLREYDNRLYWTYLEYKYSSIGAFVTDLRDTIEESIESLDVISDYINEVLDDCIDFEAYERCTTEWSHDSEFMLITTLYPYEGDSRQSE